MKTYKIEKHSNGPNFHSFTISWHWSDGQTKGMIEDLIWSDVQEFAYNLRLMGYVEDRTEVELTTTRKVV